MCAYKALVHRTQSIHMNICLQTLFAQQIASNAKSGSHTQKQFMNGLYVASTRVLKIFRMWKYSIISQHKTLSIESRYSSKNSYKNMHSTLFVCLFSDYSSLSLASMLIIGNRLVNEFVEVHACTHRHRRQFLVQHTSTIDDVPMESENQARLFSAIELLELCSPKMILYVSFETLLVGSNVDEGVFDCCCNCNRCYCCLCC